MQLGEMEVREKRDPIQAIYDNLTAKMGNMETTTSTLTV